MKKQVWISQAIFYEAKQRCAVLEAENAALKAEVASLRIAQQGQPKIICPECGGEAYHVQYCFNQKCKRYEWG